MDKIFEIIMRIHKDDPEQAMEMAVENDELYRRYVCATTGASTEEFDMLRRDLQYGYECAY
jgi:hypothetical protein